MSKFRRIKHSLNIKKAIFSRDFVTFAAKFGDAVPVSCLMSGGFREMPKYQIAVSTFRKRINLVANVIGTPKEIWLARAVMNQMKLFLLVI